jgi:hypothetical protein
MRLAIEQWCGTIAGQLRRSLPRELCGPITRRDEELLGTKNGRKK